MEDFFKTMNKAEVFPWGSFYISASKLKRVKKSPLHYKEEEIEPTPAMDFGSAYHCFILEPARFESEYYVFDDSEIYNRLIAGGASSPRATKEYKEWAENQKRVAADRSTVSQDDFRKIKAMKERLDSNFYIRSILKGGEAEKPYCVKTTVMDDSQVKIMIKPDKVRYDKRVIIELKTTQDASLDSFQKDCAKYSYHLAASLYYDVLSQTNNGISPWTFLFIAQETKKPFAFNIFEPSAQFLSQGRYEYEQLTMLLQYCQEKGKWPGYEVFCQNKFGITELNLPKWAINDLTYYNHD